MSNNVTPAVSRTQKSRIFEMVFCDKRELLGLYNAVNCTRYEKPELLEINTLENAIYLSMHNDLSFIIDSKLTLYEHQSTYSPNLPLRYLLYVMELRLSDAFQMKEDECFLELRVTLLNINPGHNQKLLKTCTTLEDYSRYSALVRNYVKTIELKAAVEKSIDECIRNDVLAEFLKKSRTEAIKVSIYEYDEERTMRQMREEGYEDGHREGR